ncbi:amine oxidase [Sphingomonas panacisoli]|uniref:Amine oxidase n=1 Tax=Sphingomonas panacisoli TaxID=1813879 RepID=A0A5B8LJU3_9SPHN|nr:FAD-dependent oxidoreductase [Sphingomonas panacisoli]QDZ08508.1 amine oxidase [Sphingomonas panacisoli]
MRGPTAFWQALEKAREENLKAAGEAAPVPGSDGQTRRQVLMALAATAATAALPRQARALTTSGAPVVIIGGGIAGLSALWQLTKAGVDARLYEARTRTGGRMYTAKAKGQPAIEVGGQLVNTDHADMHALCKEFGVALIDRKVGAYRTMILDGATEVPRDTLVAGLRGIAGQIDADSARLDKDYEKVAAELDRMSFTGYLDKHAKLIPEPWVHRLMEATARTEYGSEPGDCSALELVFNLPTIEGQRIDVLSRSDERFLMAGGSSSLIEAMTARLASRITTFRRATRIDRIGSGARVTFSNGERIQASAVIVTVPISIVSRIAFGTPLPPLWRQYNAEVGLGRNGKVQAVTTARPWEASVGRGGEVWQTDHGVGSSLGWDGGIRPSEAAGSVWTWFTGGNETLAADAADPHALALKFARMAEGGVKGMAAATSPTVRRTNWHLDPFTRGAYVNYRPGQLTKFAPLIWTETDGVASRPIDSGPVHFAGEHLSDAYPGYMNGGAQTGRLAAQAVMAAMAPVRKAG